MNRTPYISILVFLAFFCGERLFSQEGGEPAAAEETTGTAQEHVVPKTEKEARALIAAIKGRIDKERKQDPVPETLIGFLERQVKALEALAADLKARAELPARLERIEAEKRELIRKKTQAEERRREYITFSPEEIDQTHLDELRGELKARLGRIEEESKRQINLTRSQESLTKTLAALEEKIKTAEASLSDARARLGEKTDAGAVEELFALELEKASLEARKALILEERKKRALEARIELSKARTAWLKAETALLSRKVKQLQDELARTKEDELFKLRRERARFEDKLESAREEHKSWWRLQIEGVDLAIETIEIQAVARDWEARVGTTGQLAFDIREALALQKMLALQEEGASLETRRRLRLEARERMLRAEKALEELRKLREECREKVARNKAWLAALPRRLEEARARALTGYDPSVEATDPARWDELEESLRARATALRKALLGLRDVIDSSILQLQNHLQVVSGNLAELGKRILFTRGPTHISRHALNKALHDLPRLGEGLQAMLAGWWEAFSDLVTNPSRRTEAVTALAVALVVLVLLLVLHRHLPRTFSWIEDQERGPRGRLSRILALVLRRTWMAFLVAVVLAGLPALLDLADEVIGSLVVVFATPFIYRFLRVLLDVLVAPEDSDARLLQLDDETAALLHRAGRRALTLSLVFVPAGLLLHYGRYDQENPGLTELWWLVYRTGILLILMFSIFRPSVILSFVKAQSQIARSAAAVAVLGYPLVVLSILALFILYGLNFDEAARTFLIAEVKTLLTFSVAWVLYRLTLRAVRPEADFNRKISQDEFESDEAYRRAGRELCFDRLIRLGLRLLCFVPAFLVSIGYWPDFIWEFLDSPLISPDGVTWGDMLAGILMVWVFTVFLRHYKALMTFVILPRTKLDPSLQYTVTTLSSYLLVATGFVIVLKVLGVKGEQIALVTSALAVGIGFGLQSIIRNLVSGIILLIERPVRVGDMITVGDRSGKVDKITIRATRVITWDGIGVVIPNEQLIEGTLVNASIGQPRLRNDIQVGVAYGSDVKQVKELLLEAAKEHGLVLKRPAPEVFFMGFGDSSLDFLLRFWTAMGVHRLRVCSDLRASIDATLARHGIEIPFPQRDLHLRSVDPSVMPGGRDRPAPEPDPVPEESPDEDPQEAGSGSREEGSDSA